jgi:rhamnosyltransferase subunit B
MAIGIELRRRGHHVTLATSGSYEPKVRSEGLDFVALRPDVSIVDDAMLEQMMEARRGTERVMRFLVAATRESYQDTLPAARQADVVVTHPIVFGSVLAAQKTGVRWVSTVLAPASFLSAYDPPVPAPAPWLVNVRMLGPVPVRGLIALGKLQTSSWIRPIAELRREIGLSPGANPLFEGQHSPLLVLALFAKCLARPQRDWPPQTVVTGFPFYDRHHEHQGLPAKLERFLADGPAPVVFSLGTSAVGAAGDFYTESLTAVRRLGVRAVFLTGQHPQGLPADVMAIEYAPHSELFPRAAVVVHHGGIGTTAQAMLCGRPMLIVPFSHDQFDNGARVKRLGMAEVLYRGRYRAKTAEGALRRLLEDARYAQAGAAVASQVKAEDGVAAAAEAIERIA